MNACFSFLILLVIAGVCGSVAKAMTGYSHGGCLVSVFLGFIGAMIGGWLAGVVGLPDILVLDIAGVSFPVVWSVIGAVIFSLALGLLTRRAPPRT